MRKLAVCYPGDMPTVFMRAFQSIVNIDTPADCEVRWFCGLGLNQGRRRVRAAEAAIEWGAELIAQLDVDQVYEPDILQRLVDRHDGGYTFVAAMVPGRGHMSGTDKPFTRLGWKLKGREFVSVDPSEGDIQKAEFPCSNATLCRADDMIRLSKPWWDFRYDEDGNQTAGEDATFAFKMYQELGVQGYVDTTIKVGHCHVFQIDDTFPDRFADWAENPGDLDLIADRKDAA